MTELTKDLQRALEKLRWDACVDMIQNTSDFMANYYEGVRDGITHAQREFTAYREARDAPSDEQGACIGRPEHDWHSMPMTGHSTCRRCGAPDNRAAPSDEQAFLHDWVLIREHLWKCDKCKAEESAKVEPSQKGCATLDGPERNALRTEPRFTGRPCNVCMRYCVDAEGTCTDPGCWTNSDAAKQREAAPSDEQGEAPKNEYEPWKQHRLTELEYYETPLTVERMVEVLRGLCVGENVGGWDALSQLADALEAEEG